MVRDNSSGTHPDMDNVPRERTEPDEAKKEAAQPQEA